MTCGDLFHGGDTVETPTIIVCSRPLDHPGWHRAADVDVGLAWVVLRSPDGTQIGSLVVEGLEDDHTRDAWFHVEDETTVVEPNPLDPLDVVFHLADGTSVQFGLHDCMVPAYLVN